MGSGERLSELAKRWPDGDRVAARDIPGLGYHQVFGFNREPASSMPPAVPGPIFLSASRRVSPLVSLLAPICDECPPMAGVTNPPAVDSTMSTRVSPSKRKRPRSLLRTLVPAPEAMMVCRKLPPFEKSQVCRALPTIPK